MTNSSIRYTKTRCNLIETWLGQMLGASVARCRLGGAVYLPSLVLNAGAATRSGGFQKGRCEKGRTGGVKCRADGRRVARGISWGLRDAQTEKEDIHTKAVIL